MKRFCVLAMLWAAAVSGGLADEPRFSQIIKPEDFTAAGLSRLSPEELSRLDQLIQDYKGGALETARQQAAAAAAAEAAAETRALNAEAEAKAARDAQAAAEKAKSEIVAQAKEERRASGGFLARAKVLIAPGTKIEYQPIESRILGDVIGWDAHTIFTLENGQRWQVADYSHYFDSKGVTNPKVVVRQSGMMGGFKMDIEGMIGVRVRLVGEGIVNPAPESAPPVK